MTGSIETRKESRLEQRLRSGVFVKTAEFRPTSVSDQAELDELITALPPSLDAAFVQLSGSVSGAICCSRLCAHGIEPVLVASTRDLNREALLAEIRGSALVGTRNVLCLPGEHISRTSAPEAATVYDVDPVQLIWIVRDHPALAPVFIGAEAYPQLRPLPLTLIDSRKKVAAGARFLVTSPIFDITAFDEWMSAIRQEGLHERTFIIATVEVADAERAQAAATVSRLGSIAGLRGIQIRSPTGPNAIAEIIRTSVSAK